MVNKSVPKFGVEEIVARMQAGARRSRLSATDDYKTTRRTSSRSTNEGRLDLERIELQPAFRVHSDNHYQVNDLLKYHDRAFIQNAYLAVLKRGPDATGFHEFIDALRSGRMNKIDVLARLRYSAEGRAKKVEVDGLLLPAGIRLLYRIPLIGYLLNLLVAIARLPNSLRHEQQFQAHALAQQEVIAEHTNHLADTIQSFSRHMATLKAEISNSLSQSMQKTAELRSKDQLRDDLLARFRAENELLQKDLKTQQTSLFAKLSQLNDRFENAIATEREGREAGFRDLQQRVDAAFSSEQSARERGLDQLADALQAEQTAWAASFDRLTQAMIAEQGARESGLDGLGVALAQDQRAREQAFNTLSADLNEKLVGVTETQNAQAGSLAAQLRGDIQNLYQRLQQARVELVLQGERVARLLDGLRTGSSDPSKPAQVEVAAGADHALDAFYLSLEDHFRGDRAEIKERLRVYLPWIERSAIGSDDRFLLDVGCGRGEWLELLREQGVRAVGVDSNRALARQCRELNLEVVEADLISHLRSLPDESLGAITGFHVIEHLPIEALVKFLDQTVRVLKPGGLVIFETPNPQNVLVGTCNFYFDPTHRNPLPSPIARFLLESRGFTNVEVLNLNPSDELPVAGDTDLVRRFNQYFYGPMDYAVVGTRPGTN